MTAAAVVVDIVAVDVVAAVVVAVVVVAVAVVVSCEANQGRSRVGWFLPVEIFPVRNKNPTDSEFFFHRMLLLRIHCKSFIE